jgi:hypothetical protein
MFAYNPRTENRAGEIYGRNAILSAQMLADAQERASQLQAQSMLDSANRRHQAIVDGAGLVGDVAKKAVGFMVGGPAGAAMASGMGGGGGGDGGGGLLSAFTQYFGAKQDSKTIDKMAGMARDEGLMTQDTLEKFVNLPWKEKAPVFDLWRQTMMPIQANRMKVQDQAQIWSDYRGGDAGMPASAAANRYGYVYQGP